MFHLISVIFLKKTALVQHSLKINHLQFDFKIDLSSLRRVFGINDKRICYSRFEQFKKTYCALYVDVLH
jgi:hypothetical protein